MDIQAPKLETVPGADTRQRSNLAVPRPVGNSTAFS
jgi:hypothetical protein